MSCDSSQAADAASRSASASTQHTAAPRRGRRSSIDQRDSATQLVPTPTAANKARYQSPGKGSVVRRKTKHTQTQDDKTGTREEDANTTDGLLVCCANPNQSRGPSAVAWYKEDPVFSGRGQRVQVRTARGQRVQLRTARGPLRAESAHRCPRPSQARAHCRAGASIVP